MRSVKLLVAFCAMAGIFVFAAWKQEPTPNAPDSTTVFGGERLVYKIEWDPPWYFFFLPSMEAGEAELQLNGNKEHNGAKALEIRLNGHSSGTLVKMAGMKIEDEFVFITKPESFCTLSSSSHIREGKRKRQVDVQYFGETRQLHIRDVDESTVPPRVRKDEIKNDIPPCVHDPVSAIYLFRQASLREGYSETFTLANDDKIKEVKALVEKKELIQGPSGKTLAWRVTPQALMGGLFREGGQFRMWFSADEKKVPLQFEVKVKIGRIFGRLRPAR